MARIVRRISGVEDVKVQQVTGLPVLQININREAIARYGINVADALPPVGGIPYHRLQNRRSTFDEVAALSVEGLNKSAIALVKQIACNTSFDGSKRQPIRTVGSTIEE